MKTALMASRLLLAIAGAVVVRLARRAAPAAGASFAELDSGNTPTTAGSSFVRLRYNTGFGGGSAGAAAAASRLGARLPARRRPHHEDPQRDDAPCGTHVDGSNIYSLDDPELCNYPIAYMSEPGFWSMRTARRRTSAAYLKKGGFVIFDDFRGQDWWNLAEQMRRVLPEARWIEIDGKHPVFHSFFEIKNPSFLAVDLRPVEPTYWGIFEDNDPTKRLMAIANVNNDLGEYWEFSDTGLAPVDLSNEAYKFGVNYFIYGLTR